MTEERFVVTRPYPGSGIGSNLVSLAGAVWLADQLGRDVIVDWRNSNFLRDKAANVFTEFLEPVEEIQGVRLHYAQGATAAWDTEDRSGGTRHLEPAEVGELLASGSNATHLVLTPFHSYDRIEPHGDPLDQFRRLREFLGYIAPRDFLSREIERFASENRFDTSFVVAVSIATGNGEYRKGSPFHGRVATDIFRDERRFLRTLRRARAASLRRLPNYLREQAVTFVTTDSSFMREILLQLPNAVTRRSVFPPPGVGRGFADYEAAGYTDRDAFTDILVDHFLLGRCHALIRNPSMFSTYALISTRFYNGNVRNVETMYARQRLSSAARYARALARR